jgi:hypothetical protein
MKDINIKDLSEQDLKDLMYNICRSGRLVIPQFYYKEHIANFLGSEPTSDDMISIQSVIECDYTTHEYLDNTIEEIIDNNL